MEKAYETGFVGNEDPEAVIERANKHKVRAKLNRAKLKNFPKFGNVSTEKEKYYYVCLFDPNAVTGTDFDKLENLETKKIKAGIKKRDQYIRLRRWAIDGQISLDEVFEEANPS